MSGPRRGLGAEQRHRDLDTWRGVKAHALMYRTIHIHRKHWLLRLIDRWNRSP